MEQKQIAALIAEMNSLRKASNRTIKHALIFLLMSTALHLSGHWVAEDPESLYRRIEVLARFFMLGTGILMLLLSLIGETIRGSKEAYLEEIEKEG